MLIIGITYIGNVIIEYRYKRYSITRYTKQKKNQEMATQNRWKSNLFKQDQVLFVRSVRHCATCVCISWNFHYILKACLE